MKTEYVQQDTVLIEDVKKLTLEWKEFFEESKLDFLLNDLDSELIEDLLEFEVCQLNKYMDDLGIGTGEQFWRVHLTFEYMGSKYELDIQETETEWYNCNYEEGGGEDVYAHFEETINKMVTKVVLNPFLTEFLSPKYNLNVSFT